MAVASGKGALPRKTLLAALSLTLAITACGFLRVPRGIELWLQVPRVSSAPMSAAPPPSPYVALCLSVKGAGERCTDR